MELFKLLLQDGEKSLHVAKWECSTKCVTGIHCYVTSIYQATTERELFMDAENKIRVRLNFVC